MNLTEAGSEDVNYIEVRFEVLIAARMSALVFWVVDL
jgi:hypothetical protein